MPTRPAKTAENVADSVADTVKSVIDRVVDAELTRQIARRGQEVAGILAERGADVSERATDAWRETQPMRRDAVKAVTKAGGDAAKASNDVWRGSLRPALKDLWRRRTVAIGAAGAAVPASRELIESAAVRLGLKEREREEERRRWGAFFLGLVIGALAGAAVALLTTPKRGSEVRRELGARADEMRRELGDRAEEIAARAREAEWMPVFQRQNDSGNGHTPTVITDAQSVQAGASDAGDSEGGGASGPAADQAASDAAEAINEAYDVDREAVDRETSG